MVSAARRSKSGRIALHFILLVHGASLQLWFCMNICLLAALLFREVASSVDTDIEKQCEDAGHPHSIF